jgi:hypothetical protein
VRDDGCAGGASARGESGLVTDGTTGLTCRELVEVLADYLASELGRDARSVFEGHLVECRDCLAYLRSYAETMRLAKHAYDDDEAEVNVG